MMVNHDHTRIRQVQRIMISRSVVKRPRLCKAHRSHQDLTSHNIQWHTVELQWRHIEIVAGSVLQSFETCHLGAQARTALTETILQPRASS